MFGMMWTSNLGSPQIGEHTKSPAEMHPAFHCKEVFHKCFQHLIVASSIHLKTPLKEVGWHDYPPPLKTVMEIGNLGFLTWETLRGNQT